MQYPKSVFRLLAVAVAVCLVLGSGIVRADDTEIAGWVKNALRHDQRVDAKEIDVTSRDGIVILSGDVPTIASRRFAILEAQKIRGVMGVTNELKIVAEKRPDTDIVRDIEQRIAHNATIVSKGLVVGCLDGYVTLSGEVADYAEELEAELIAEEVRGVKQVQNHLLTGFIRKHTDEQVQRDVMATLTRDAYLTGLPVAAKVQESVVTLSGQVASAYQKRLAEDDVHKLEHVKAVHNDISIVPSLDNGTRQETVWPTEEDLEAAVKSELDQDSRIDATKIDVSVEYGHVVLDGVTRTHRERTVAEMDARNIVGVQSVANKLTVNGPRRDDSQIQSYVALALASDAMLSDFDLTAKSSRGTVTLSGEVDTMYERVHAQDLARRVRGVIDTNNRIKVDHNSEYADATLTQEIVSRLKQNKETHVCAELIEVEVINGVAVLTGVVDSWAEYQEAEHVAFHTNGIWKVKNDLIVEGFDYPWDDFRKEGLRRFDPADPEIPINLFSHNCIR